MCDQFGSFPKDQLIRSPAMCRRNCIVRSCLCLVLAALCLSPAVGAAPSKSKAEANAAKEPQWTLYCQAIGGPAHVEQAKSAKEQLIKQSKLKDWYVIHQDTESIIYYGYYRTINDPKDKKESERAQRDRKEIGTLADASGNLLFDHCFFVEITAPDPTAPPEWNLLNAEGYWSLQIAAYKDSPHRKEAALEAVKAAREQGLPAYFYHGETTSSVCIGAWPRAAVKEQDEANAGAPDPEQDLLVLPQPLADQDNVVVRNQDGKRVRTLAPRFEPVDPSMIAMMAKYPTHAVNGVTYVSKAKDPATGEIKEFEDPSFLVPIPRAKPGLLRAQQPAPALIAPDPAPATGGGKLRSIGD
jgi:hypothetical protein